MKPKIILISPPCFGIENDALEQNLGLAYIASSLKANGFDAIIREYTGLSKAEFQQSLNNLEFAQIYGVSIMSTSFSNAKRIIASIREQYPHAYIIAGGVHVSAMPHHVLRNTEADVAIIGEGELTFVQLVNDFVNARPIRGIVKGVSPSNLDLLPFPDRLCVDQSRYTRKLNGKPVLSVLSSRGCRFACVHCNSTIMGGGSHGIRFRSISNIVAEINELRKLGYDSFQFNDDSFTDRPDVDALIQTLGQLGISFRIFARLNSLNEKRIKLLADCGCELVSIGIESVNPKNLEFLHKGKMPYNMLTVCKKYHLRTRVSFMVGLPHDTYESIRADFGYANTLDFDEFAVYSLIPYPGTRIWETPEKYGYIIKDRNYENYVQLGHNKCSAAVMSHVSEDGYRFTSDDVSNWCTLANDILGKCKQHMKYSRTAQ